MSEERKSLTVDEEVLRKIIMEEIMEARKNTIEGRAGLAVEKGVGKTLAGGKAAVDGVKDAGKFVGKKAKEFGNCTVEAFVSGKNAVVDGAVLTYEAVAGAIGRAVDKVIEYKDATVQGVKDAANYVGDKAVEAKDATVKGVKVAAKATKEAAIKTGKVAGKVAVGTAVVGAAVVAAPVVGAAIAVNEGVKASVKAGKFVGKKAKEFGTATAEAYVSGKNAVKEGAVMTYEAIEKLIDQTVDKVVSYGVATKQAAVKAAVATRDAAIDAKDAVIDFGEKKIVRPTEKAAAFVKGGVKALPSGVKAAADKVKEGAKEGKDNAALRHAALDQKRGR